MTCTQFYHETSFSVVFVEPTAQYALQSRVNVEQLEQTWPTLPDLTEDNGHQKNPDGETALLLHQCWKKKKRKIEDAYLM